MTRTISQSACPLLSWRPPYCFGFSSLPADEITWVTPLFTLLHRPCWCGQRYPYIERPFRSVLPFSDHWSDLCDSDQSGNRLCSILVHPMVISMNSTHGKCHIHTVWQSQRAFILNIAHVELPWGVPAYLNLHSYPQQLYNLPTLSLTMCKLQGLYHGGTPYPFT